MHPLGITHPGIVQCEFCPVGQYERGLFREPANGSTFHWNFAVEEKVAGVCYQHCVHNQVLLCHRRAVMVKVDVSLCMNTPLDIRGRPSAALRLIAIAIDLPITTYDRKDPLWSQEILDAYTYTDCIPPGVYTDCVYCAEWGSIIIFGLAILLFCFLFKVSQGFLQLSARISSELFHINVWHIGFNPWICVLPGQNFT